MAKLKIVVAAVASLACSYAHAADMQLPMPEPMIPAPVVEDVVSGWYLRGDIGYRFNSVGKANYSPAGLADLSNNTLKDGGAYGGGIGYKAGWIRGDITFDYATPQRYSGDVLLNNVLHRGDARVDVSSVTGLFNLYFDLGTWGGLTPYIGAGVGATQFNVSNYRANYAIATGRVPENQKWNFAWAAMAGVSYSLTDSFLIDVGYRYLSMGDARTGSDSLGRYMNLRDISAQEVRIGVRWMLGDYGFF